MARPSRTSANRYCPADSQPPRLKPDSVAVLSTALFSTQNSLLQHNAPPEFSRPPAQSASIWRHSSLSYSFSKDQRFKNRKETSQFKGTMPSTKSKRSCSFGKGGRSPYPALTLKRAKEVANVSSYDVSLSISDPRKGKTFGQSFLAYEKVAHEGMGHAFYSAHQTKDNPPAHYQVREKPGQGKRKFSILGRLRMFNEQEARSRQDLPGAKYEVRSRLLDRKVGFGVGQRQFLARAETDSPGPIYLIS